MANPFRRGGETPTAAALAKLEAMPADSLHCLCALWVSYREASAAPANPASVAAARNLKLTYVGSAVEGIAPSFRKQIFVDEDATTQAHISSFLYFFATYFESGKCILTFDHTPGLQTSDVLLARAGAGDFANDYAAHCTLVADWVDGGEVTIIVRDIATAVRLGRHYYRHVLAIGDTASILMTPSIVVISFLLVIAYFFR